MKLNNRIDGIFHAFAASVLTLYLVSLLSVAAQRYIV
tara:strand:- start:32 stop:142 length:111 start_codon:yes stop_codon:yes gene_type:complete